MTCGELTIVFNSLLNSCVDVYAVLISSTAPHVWARGTQFKPILELMLMMIGCSGIVFMPVTKYENCRRHSLSKLRLSSKQLLTYVKLHN